MNTQYQDLLQVARQVHATLATIARNGMLEVECRTDEERKAAEGSDHENAELMIDCARAQLREALAKVDALN